VNFFKILFPSWLFFDRVGALPRLSWRPHDLGQNQGPWIPLGQTRPPLWRELFYNPERNQLHAIDTLLQRFLTELSHASESQTGTDSVTFHLIEAYVRFCVREQSAAEMNFQVRISVMESQDQGIRESDVLIFECENNK